MNLFIETIWLCLGHCAGQMMQISSKVVSIHLMSGGKNLKKWYKWISLQSRNKDTDVKNKVWTPRGERESGINWEIEIGIYTLLIGCCQLLSHVQLFAIPWTSLPGPSLGKNTGEACHFLLQGISWFRNQTGVSWISSQIIYHWAIREVLPILCNYWYYV